MGEYDYDYEYKIVFLGGSGVGAKTSLISRLNNDYIENPCSTAGGSYTPIYIQVNLGIIKLLLWDTAGQERFWQLSRYFIKGSHCVILGYDITNKRSFSDIQEFWYNHAKNIVSEKSLIYLVANKIDLIGKEEVSEKEAMEYAKEKGIKYFRVSAKTGEGVNELLDDISYSLIIKFKNNINKNDINLLREDEKKIKRIHRRNNIEIILNKYLNY